MEENPLPNRQEESKETVLKHSTFEDKEERNWIFFSWQHVGAMVFTAVLFVLLAIIPWGEWDFIDPISETFADFEITDLVFSKLRTNQEIDTNIVIVSIGTLPRAGIAEQIRLIQLYQPKVIGIDAFFWKRKDSLIDQELINSLKDYNNVVVVTKLDSLDTSSEAETKDWKVLKTSFSEFHSTAKSSGFANMYSDEDKGFRTIRGFVPSQTVKGKKVNNFAVEVAKIFDSNSVQLLHRRNKEVEVINYRGDHNSFYFFDYDQITPETDLQIVKDKIVLLGFVDNRFSDETGYKVISGSVEDAFFTPMNKKYVGKTYPDMYGVVVHANVISMILHKQYIDKIPKYLSLIVVFIFTYFSIVLLTYLYNKFKKYYDTVALVTQIFMSTSLMFIFLLIFDTFNFDADFTLVFAILGVLINLNGLEIYFGLVTQVKILYIRYYVLRNKKV